ncbi:MAG TPA: endonuclease/exonuclease/phosphatase family protein [Streptosporangiaceae bacterium]
MGTAATGLVALILTVAALPALIARARGGTPPGPGPRLAALAPVGAVLAIAGAAVAAATAWWLLLPLLIPALILAWWQRPPSRPPSPAPRPGGTALSGTTGRLRVLTLNVKRGRANADAVLRTLRQYQVDILAVQEMTADWLDAIQQAGVTEVLPFSQADPRPGSGGGGLWTRWPLTPLAPVPGMKNAAPRARIEPAAGQPVTVTVVHPAAPVNRQEQRWQRDLETIRSALAEATGPQLVAGDFNASRDHRVFRDILRSGFVDCADAAQQRHWPGFTWPADRRYPPLMRLDHVLGSRAGCVVHQARTMRIPGTDHRGLLAVLEFSPIPRLQ